MDENVKRNTASLLDAINSGDVRSVYRILRSDLDIDANADVSDVYDYTTVEVPRVIVDCIDNSEVIRPRKLLGCALLRDDTRILALLFTFGMIRTIEDYDAIICIHYSTAAIHNMVLNKFPWEMTNKNLYAGPSNVLVGADGVLPNSVGRLYTPIHIFLMSLWMSQIVSNCFPRRVSFFSTQTTKFLYTVRRGGIFDTRMRRLCTRGVLTHLLLTNFMELAKETIEAGFLDNFTQVKFIEFIHLCIPRMRRNPILFLLYDPINNHLHFPGDSVFQNKLLHPSFLRSRLSGSITAMTEFIVNNYFVFYADTYRMRVYDTPARLYNLFQAGVYLMDDLDYSRDLPIRDPITAHVLRFIDESKTPFPLEFLCKLYIKRRVGPKNHYQKIESLGLPQLITNYIVGYKYTQNNILYFPDAYAHPHDQIRGRIRYHDDDDDLI